jgi:hypothetical protein
MYEHDGRETPSLPATGDFRFRVGNRSRSNREAGRILELPLASLGEVAEQQLLLSDRLDRYSWQPSIEQIGARQCLELVRPCQNNCVCT